MKNKPTTLVMSLPTIPVPVAGEDPRVLGRTGFVSSASVFIYIIEI
jgi:hypothetical protein